ncbi:hypothetical protein BK816_00840 [Boudabousia tangfeifanii]|uniref:Nucleotidyl transferase AbiEii/AbiGii toxin family protein n=1 Tax=Boudabousia tangfeifanii TaxID=1912795 RepID=A0A1D9MIK4_9ACTO|nr:nucleotidyl transferase AbiEii/AbiGii toxin family protein [Boudabousia tangfeifanii]AOZ72020.1 hypothetical protein BK816_00840 [Boudabousia tangfeifanii]
MKYDDIPPSVRSLEQRIRNLEKDAGLVQRRRIAMALVVVSQMLPEGAVKGGSAMALRYGRNTRFTRDLDAARVKSMEKFRSDFESSLAYGWAGFTGRLVKKSPPKPAGIPSAYVMQPFEVKLDYKGRSWCTVSFELGHNEIGDTDDPEYRISKELVELFAELGLENPKPVPVMRSGHQIAQKLHAVSSPGSDRARDLVDLQLLVSAEEDLDFSQVATTCSRLFRYRKQQSWPPTISSGKDWPQLYEEAAQELDVLPTVHEALAWTNNLISQITSASENSL